MVAGVIGVALVTGAVWVTGAWVAGGTVVGACCTC